MTALRTDFENWKSMLGFRDDDGDLFHQMFRVEASAARSGAK